MTELDWEQLPVSIEEAEAALQSWLDPQRLDFEGWSERIHASSHQIHVRLSERLRSRHLREDIDFRVIPSVKQWDSIRVKLEAGLFANWSEVTDLIRYRVLTPSTESASRVRQAFDIDIKNGSLDRKLWWQSDGPGKGYAAVHFQLSLVEEDDVPPAQHGCGVEVQILTNLQAAWSDLTHAFYKSKFESLMGHPDNLGAPSSLRERVFRLAAALELLDEEIQAVKTDFEPARRKIKLEVESAGWEHVQLDEVSLGYVAVGQFAGLLDSVRSIGRSLGFRESAWRPHVTAGQETLDFVAFCHRNELYSLKRIRRLLEEFVNSPEPLGFERIRAMVSNERARVTRIDDFLMTNRPLFVLMLYCAMKDPMRVNIEVRHRFQASFWRAIYETPSGLLGS